MERGGREGEGKVGREGAALSRQVPLASKLRVKVAACCRGHAALIPGGAKSVLSP